MTRNLCAHPAQLLNPTISKFCYSFYMVLITLYNSKILLSLHYFLTPKFQTFTNLLIGIFGVSNPTFFFFFRFLRSYVSIIVNIISNNTVLNVICFVYFVNKKAPPTHSAHLGLNPTPSPQPQKHNPFFSQVKSANYRSPSFQAIHQPP